MTKPDAQTENSRFDKEPAEGSREIVERELKRREEGKQPEPAADSVEVSEVEGMTEALRQARQRSKRRIDS